MGTRARHNGRIESVTVIAPMLNEAAYIEAFVLDVASQDYRGAIDVVVADGGSTDGSVTSLERAAADAGLPVVVLSNPDRFVSHGLNACVQRATGDLIVRLDCHSRYPADYVRLCAETSEATNAWNVGGVLVPEGRTVTERAVAAAMDGPFGGIGWTRAASSSAAVEVDTVTFGAFRPAVFEEVGLFDERLVRNQDADLNLRIRRAGGRIVLDPRIRVRYVPRGTLAGVFRQYFEYGRWRMATMRKNRERPGVRTLAPAAFVAALVVLAALAPWSSVSTAVLAGVGIAYLAAAVVFGARALRGRSESLGLLPRVVASYAAFHLGHGLGMLRGLVGPVGRPAAS